MASPAERPDLTRSDMLQRPPHGETRRPTGKPLIVTPVFLARADCTPWSDRAHDDGWAVGKDGKMVSHPDKHPSDLALEPDPNLAFEHWDQYWRKVHGVKYAYEEPGASNRKILRYDQVHRVASGPQTGWQPPYRAMIDDDGKLPREPALRVPPYRRPQWDGIAYIAFETEEDVRGTLAQEQYVVRFTADEQVLFRKVTNDMAREHIFIASERHRDPISLVKIHARRADLTREASRNACSPNIPRW